MKSLLKVGCVLIASLVASAPVAFGQQSNRTGMRMPAYDTSAETSIAGTVVEVVQPQRDRMMGTHLLVKTNTETIEVHLGPANFISREGFTFTKGDSVEILGSKVPMRGSEVLIAREVTKDGQKLTLRDETGRPLWAGRGMSRSCCAR